MQVASQAVSALTRGISVNPTTSPSGEIANRPGQGATNFVSSLTDALKEVNPPPGAGRLEQRAGR